MMKKSIVSLLIFLVLIPSINPTPIQAEGEGVTAVQERTDRVAMNFNTDWLFHRGDANGAEEIDFYDSYWEEVTLPHTVRLEPKEWTSSPSYQGISWYRRHFSLDESYSGKKIFVQFEGAMINADVWINGKHLTTHHGGYLPFTVDISDDIRFGEDNVIAVKVDSRDDWETPPGKPQRELDFVYFGGLYRDVNLYVTDKLHVTDAIFADKVADGGVFITYPEVSEEKAVVEIKTNVKNEYSDVKNVSVETTIVDAENNVVAKEESESQPMDAEGDHTFVQTVTIDNPKLWSMNDPNLHMVYTKVKDGDHYVDDYSTRIGIRRIEFTADEGFFINGERVLLNGVNHHEDYLYTGNAVSDSMLYRDVKQIKDAGFNFIRAGHYPHNQAFMDACDELGIAVIVPTPGWQYFTDEGEFAERSIQMTREMVRRDRNHPSVVVWEPILNEAWYPDEFAQAAYDAVHEEYPGDQAYAASDFGLSKGEMFDVVYKEAYSETKPLITREWGDANHNVQDGERSGRKFGERSLINSSIHRQNSLKGNSWKDDDEEDGYWDWAGLNANPRISGYALWSYNDYNRGMDRNIAYSGIVDRDRYPKFNYYWFQSQRNPDVILDNADSGPMVFIANYWTESSPRDVNVYSNAEEVKLYVNDNLIHTRTPDNVEHIFHPIFTFPDVPWEPGELKAEGLIDGEVVATYTVNTPGEPDHLSVEFDTKGIDHLTADSSDMVMAYVTVRDRDGNIVPTATDSISLHLSGPGKLVGNGEGRVKANPVQAEAGVAPAVIRSTLSPGEITLTATAQGLTSGSAVIESIPYDGYFVPGGSDEEDRPIKGENVALNKLVTVSSEQSDNPGSNVNDGDQTSLWIPAKTDPGQWAKVDLGEDRNILGTEVTWGTSDQEKKYKIEVSENDETWITVVDQTESEKAMQKQSDRFAANARYVRITLTDQSDEYGGLGEFVIFGGDKSSDDPIDEDSRENIATGKPTSASSFSPGNEPSLAVDNNPNTAWRAETYDVPQWLQVNLEDYYTLSGAKILWGKDSTYYVYRIQVSRDGDSWTDVLEKTTTGSHYHPVDFSAYAARYVRIAVDDLMAGGGDEEAAIRELEIYGEKTEKPSVKIPQSGMSVTATSEETVGENAPASNVLDGDPQTFWHTKWSGTADHLPQSLTIELGGTYMVDQFRYLPRQNSLNGKITSYKLYVSTDGRNFTEVDSGDWEVETTEEQVVSFTSQQASHVRLEVLEGFNNFATAAELNVYMDPSAAALKNLVERLEEEGELIDDDVARSLKVHLVAVDRFEKQEAAKKVIKHMESFKLLLDHQKENKLISEEVSKILQTHSDYLIEKWTFQMLMNDAHDA